MVHIELDGFSQHMLRHARSFRRAGGWAPALRHCDRDPLFL